MIFDLYSSDFSSGRGAPNITLFKGEAEAIFFKDTAYPSHIVNHNPYTNMISISFDPMPNFIHRDETGRLRVHNDRFAEYSGDCVWNASEWQPDAAPVAAGKEA